jgi:hypothetical protein
MQIPTTLNRWKNYSVLNVHSVSGVRQVEINTAEQLEPGPSPFEVEIPIAKLKKCESPGSDQIAAELNRAGGEILLSVIHKLVISIWNKKEMPDQCKESITVPVYKKADCSNYCGISLLSSSYNIFPTTFSEG